MIRPYAGVYQMHIVTKRDEALTKYFEELTKDPQKKNFARMQIGNIARATYFPQVITFADANGKVKMDPQDKRFLDELKEFKKNVCNTMRLEALIAYDSHIISETEYAEICKLMLETI